MVHDALGKVILPKNSQNICPIEFKSGHEYGLASLLKYRDKFKPYLHTSYVLHDKDVSVKDGVVRLPLYMTQLVIEQGIHEKDRTEA